MALQHLAEELPPQRDRLNVPFITDAGLHQFTTAKWIRLACRPGKLTAVFWSGPRECVWVPSSPRGAAPLQHLDLHHCPEDAERAFLTVYPEYRS